MKSLLSKRLKSLRDICGNIMPFFIFNKQIINAITKVMLSSSFLLFSYALLILSRSPAKGYELSIYQSVPLIFWLSITLNIGVSLLIILLKCFGKISKIWVAGLFLLIISLCSVISLYSLHGYMLYLTRGDALTYVGFALDISKNGNVPGYNFYPATSLVAAQINEITGLSLVSVSKYISSFFYLLYILSVYCWAKSFDLGKKYAYLMLIAAFPIFFAWFTTSMYHELLSVLILPLLFYSMERKNTPEFKLIALILILVLQIYHPFTSLSAILYILIYLLVNKFFDRNNNQNHLTFNFFILSVAAFGIWYSNQYIIMNDFNTVLEEIIGELTVRSTYSEAISRSIGIGLLTKIGAILFMTIDDILYYIMAAVAIIVIFLKKDIFRLRFLTISVALIIGSCIWLVLILKSTAHTPERLINLNYNDIFTLPLVGYLLCHNLKTNRLDFLIIIGLVLASTFFSILSLYQSPTSIYPNDQGTISDLQGAKWIINYKDINLSTGGLLTYAYRYVDLIYGVTYRKSRPDFVFTFLYPDHFGFSNGSNILPARRDQYMTLTTFDKVCYTKIWKDSNRFNEGDFIKLEQSANVYKVYNNDDLSNYLLIGVNKTGVNTFNFSKDKLISYN